MCYPKGEFRVGPQGMWLGKVGGTEVSIGSAQYGPRKRTQLVLDVVPGRSFALESPRGKQFQPRSRAFTPEGG
ncbi:hypothetical protein Poly30_54280 [Planctomycetes bacterium Poly30]|uniref:Uncharacterized protein n=2 Tax=Saltatorellus ferox TaxID=2528018 RepID=A0A518F0K8_9BACT|nr:hypothetical protein Poly30_54280 [Planctomycetes bacterium Poly30]